MNHQLETFFPDSDNRDLLEKLIKLQGSVVCQSKLKKDWINTSLHEASFGIASILPKAQVGRRSLKNVDDKYSLNGFVLCRIDKDDQKTCWIDVICSRQNSKIGELLIKSAEQKIMENTTVKAIHLYSLPSPRLKKWYMSMSYGVSTVKIWDGVPKAYLMTKFI